MATSPHLTSLVAKHAHIESLIAEERLRPHPDDIAIVQLKKEKLKLKEEINKLMH
jgi:hypothetical protein